MCIDAAFGDSLADTPATRPKDVGIRVVAVFETVGIKRASFHHNVPLGFVLGEVSAGGHRLGQFGW